MPDYTPYNTDIFGKFIEGLKLGWSRQKERADAQKALVKDQFESEASERARRAESMNLGYLTNDKIRSGAEYDIATKMSAYPEMFPTQDKRRLADEVLLGQNPLPTPEGWALGSNIPVPSKGTPTTIPFDPRALGVAGYTEDNGAAATEYAQNANNLERFTAGLKALGQPSGLNIQTDASGREFIPGRGLGKPATIVSTPANPQVLEIPGAEGKFISYAGRSGENRIIQEQPTTKTLVNTVTGKTTTVPKNTEMFTPVGAAQMMETESKMTATLQGLNRLEGFLNKVPSGRFGGNAASFVNYFSGFFPEVGAAKDLGGMLKPMITRVLGGDVGNLAAAEQAAAGRLTEGLISATDTERKNAFATLRGLTAFRMEANKRRKDNDLGIWGVPLNEALADSPQWQRYQKAFQAGNFAEAAKYVPTTQTAAPKNEAW